MDICLRKRLSSSSETMLASATVRSNQPKYPTDEQVIKFVSVANATKPNSCDKSPIAFSNLECIRMAAGGVVNRLQKIQKHDGLQKKTFYGFTLSLFDLGLTINSRQKQSLPITGVLMVQYYARVNWYHQKNELEIT